METQMVLLKIMVTPRRKGRNERPNSIKIDIDHLKFVTFVHLQLQNDYLMLLESH